MIEIGVEELIADSFCGGGGASEGIFQATGRHPDIAINHDEDAIAMHKINHPETLHFNESIWDVDPVKACKGRPVGLAWFSPDCKHYSKARGGKPRDKNIRGLAWVALKWAAKVKPRVIVLENVEEFKGWGPLNRSHRPIKSKKGHTFEKWKTQLEDLGYQVQHRELVACDYGAPTTRKRFFVIARCDGRAIVWPEPTHAKPDRLEVSQNILKPWIPASSIIDWSLPSESIFDRKKPLAENTMKRIAKGIQKFVINDPKPFVISIGQTKFGKENMCYSLDQPLTTITSKAEHLLVTPVLLQYHSETTSKGVRGQRVDEPIQTIDGSNRYALVEAFLQEYNVDPKNSLSECIDPKNIQLEGEAITAAFVSRQFKSSIGHSLNEPLGTVTAVDKSRLVTAFLIKYYGEDTGQSLNSPLHTITSKDRFGIVEIHSQKYIIIDIKLRMLEPHELALATGFKKSYVINFLHKGKMYSKAKQVARIGNAVPPPFSEAITRANFPEWCGPIYFPAISA